MKKITGLLCIAVSVLLLLSACGTSETGLLLSDALPAEKSVTVQDSAASEEETVAAITDEKIYVYICGEVKSPGVYPLAADSRICELVEAAGGLTKDASEASVNLAQHLQDGEMVVIPSEAETETAALSASPGQAPAETASGSAGDTRININTASKEQLMTLNGIGETKAESILSYRESTGAFSDPADLMKVDGIGQGTFDKIKEQITV